jgi:hypothetical protein
VKMFESLAPGVLGYTVEADGVLYIPVIMAEEEGSGDVGRYLDSLPRDRTVKVPGVQSDRLRGMLERRGFEADQEWAPEFEEYVEVFILEPA